MNRLKAWVSYRRVDLALLLALFVVALVVRLPNLYEIPRYTDEVIDWWRSYDIVRGVYSPWDTVQPYLGPLIYNVIALGLKIFPGPYTPRALTVVQGALTAPATYLLVRAMGGKRAALIAGILMAVASSHIVINSHVGYANSFTPLLVAIMLTLFYMAQKRENGWFLIGAGFVGGLAMHTHPAVVALLPGMVVWFFSSRARWHWLRRPSLYLAVVAALLAFSPVLIGIVQQFSYFRTAVEARPYAYRPIQSPYDFLVNLQALLVEMSRMLGAVFPNFDAPRKYIAQPLVATYLVLIALAFWGAWRTRNWFLLAVVASGVLFIPVVNAQYGDYPYYTRYIALLLPPTYAAVALGIDALWSYLTKRFAPQQNWKSVPYAAISVGFLILLGWLVGQSLNLTWRFYDSQYNGGRTNLVMEQMVEHINAEPDKMIWLDPRMIRGEFPSGGKFLEALEVWFLLSGKPWQLAEENHVCERSGSWLIATDYFMDLAVPRCEYDKVMHEMVTTRPGFESLSVGLYRIK